MSRFSVCLLACPSLPSCVFIARPVESFAAYKVTVQDLFYCRPCTPTMIIMYTYLTCDNLIPRLWCIAKTCTHLPPLYIIFNVWRPLQTILYYPANQPTQDSPFFEWLAMLLYLKAGFNLPNVSPFHRHFHALNGEWTVLFCNILWRFLVNVILFALLHSSLRKHFNG